MSVDLRQATASLRSGTYIKLGDGKLPHRRNALMGCYPTKDGRWSYLHCNLPNHRVAALGVLGVAEDRELPGVGHRARQALRPARPAPGCQPGHLARLIREADVFSQGYRPGSLAERGCRPEALAALRPGLVYLCLAERRRSCRAWAERRGFDTVVQTVSGVTSRQAELVPGKIAGPQFCPVSAIGYCTGYLMAFGAMVALERRAREGGSWLVRVSLAQVGKWLIDFGEVSTASRAGVPDEFDAEELALWSMTSETLNGPLRHLRPVAQMSETPPRWARPSVPLGHHPPVWPERGAAWLHRQRCSRIRILQRRTAAVKTWLGAPGAPLSVSIKSRTKPGRR